MPHDASDAASIQKLFTCSTCGPTKIHWEPRASNPKRLTCSECGKKLPGTVGDARDLMVPFGIRQVMKILSAHPAPNP